MKKFKQTIKKYSFWTGLSGAVVIFANALAKCFGFEIDNVIIEDIIMSICGVLVAMGIVCAPIKTETQECLQETQQQDEITPKEQDENIDNN